MPEPPTARLSGQHHTGLLRVGSRRVIAVTGFGQEDDRAKAREAGFSAHLVKPIDLGQLAAAVKRSRPARP